MGGHRSRFQQVRKLLIDDWNLVNATLTQQMNTAGKNLVSGVMKSTGAHTLSALQQLNSGWYCSLPLCAYCLFSHSLSPLSVLARASAQIQK